MPRKPRPRWSCEFELLADPERRDPVNRLKQTLKMLLREYKMQATMVPKCSAEFGDKPVPVPTTKPTRKFTGTIKLAADSREGMLRALDEARYKLARGEKGPVSHGEHEFGYSLSVVEDETQTTENYWQQYEQWQKTQEQPAKRAA